MVSLKSRLAIHIHGILQFLRPCREKMFFASRLTKAKLSTQVNVLLCFKIYTLWKVFMEEKAQFL